MPRPLAVTLSEVKALQFASLRMTSRGEPFRGLRRPALPLSFMRGEYP